MTVSSSNDWTLTRDSLIKQSLLKIRAIDPSQPVMTESLLSHSHSLNAMLKGWQLDGVDIWLMREIVVFMDYNAQYYLIGPSGDEAAEMTDHVKTQLATAATASATSLTVDSITGIADDDKIGICQDDGTIHWDVVNGTPSGTTVTLTTGLASAAAVDSYIFAYTSSVTRPLEIIEARIRNSSENDNYVEVVKDVSAFFGQTDKTSYGETQKVFYEPLTTNGKLYVWPVCGTSEISNRLILTVKRSIYDMDSGNNTLDAPDEVIQAIIWGLADEIQVEYGSVNTLITAKAAHYYNMVKKQYKLKRSHFLQCR